MVRLTRSIEHALAAGRSRKFWFAGGLAAFLSFASWINVRLVYLLNVDFFHVDKEAVPGWWVYTLCRAAGTLWLAYVIWTMARPATMDAKEGAPRPKPAGEGAVFDPLMGLRAFACFLVVIGHYFILDMPYSQGGVPNVVNALLTTAPGAGVWIFFVLSGFLMGKGFASGRYSLDETGMRSFLRNRVLRIAPVYFGGILVICAFRYPVMFELKNWWILIQMTVFDYRGNLPYNVIPALWSVTTEMQFYLLVPMLMVGLLRVRRRLGRAFVLLPVVVLCVGTVLKMLVAKYFVDLHSTVYTPLIGNLDIFLTGLSISLFPRMKELSDAARRRLGWTMCAGMLMFYVGMSVLTANRTALHMTLNDYWARTPWIAAVFAGIFIYFSEQMGRVRLRRGPRGNLLRAVHWTGTLTYCLYVFHMDVFDGVASLVPAVHGLSVSLEKFPISIVEAFAVSALFYYLVEKPFDRRKKIPGTALMDAP